MERAKARGRAGAHVLMCGAPVRLVNMREVRIEMSADSGGRKQSGSGHVGGTRQKGGTSARGQSGAKSEGKGTGNKSEGDGKKSGKPGGERRN